MGWIWTQGIGARGKLQEKETEEVLVRVTALTARIYIGPHPQHVAQKPQCPLQLKPTHVKLYWP